MGAAESPVNNGMPGLKTLTCVAFGGSLESRRPVLDRVSCGRALLHWTRRTRIRRKRLSPVRTTAHPPDYSNGLFRHTYTFFLQRGPRELYHAPFRSYNDQFSLSFPVCRQPYQPGRQNQTFSAQHPALVVVDVKFHYGEPPGSRCPSRWGISSMELKA